MQRTMDPLDVVIVGGGQAGLAVGYYLRRTGLSYAILDAGEAPGGAWRHGWDSLRLFSPAQWSSLPGWLMPGGTDAYPHRDEVLEYLRRYEERYALPVHRPVRVEAVHREGEVLRVESAAGEWRARAVVSATGTWQAPRIPPYPGRERFRGEQLHSARYRARREGREEPPPASLGDIVMVPPVRDARARGVLRSRPPFQRFTETGVVWADGTKLDVDAVVWCTGFRAALDHLAPLGVAGPEGRIAVQGTRAAAEPRLWLVGYGDWTGFASATLIGVGRSARATVEQIAAALRPGQG